MCLVYVGGLLWGTRSTRQPTNPTIIWIIPGKREERFLPNIFFVNHFLTPTFDCELARSLNWWYFYLNFLFSEKKFGFANIFFLQFLRPFSDCRLHCRTSAVGKNYVRDHTVSETPPHQKINFSHNAKLLTLESHTQSLKTFCQKLRILNVYECCPEISWL